MADDAATRAAAALLFPQARRRVLERSAFQPARPFQGALFELLAAQPLGACIGIAVSIVLVGTEAPLTARGGLAAVADHVNLTLRSPLSGRWPGGTERVFPPLTGIYQPAVVRARGGARVYSGGVVVAGVTDAGRLTPFEVRVLRETGVFAVSDSLVPSAIIAAYYGLTLAACGVPRTDDHRDE